MSSVFHSVPMRFMSLVPKAALPLVHPESSNWGCIQLAAGWLMVNFASQRSVDRKVIKVDEPKIKAINQKICNSLNK